MSPRLRGGGDGLARSRTVVLVVCFALLAIAGLAFVGPEAQGVPMAGERPISAFSTVPQAGGAYTLTLDVRRATEDGPGGYSYRFGRFANGSHLEELAYSDPGVAAGSRNVSKVVTVGREGDVFERTSYVEGADPETVEPDVYVDERGRVVERRDADRSPPIPSIRSLDITLAEQSLGRNGTESWNGTRYRRYDLRGPRSLLERFFGERELTGYVLATDDLEIRYAVLQTAGGDTEAIYRAYPDRTPTVPSWVPTVEAAFDRELEIPELLAYERDRGVAVLASSQWVPSRNLTVALLADSDGGPATVRLPAGEPVFAARADGTFGTRLVQTGDGLVLSRSESGPPASFGSANASGFEPRGLLVDWRGRNVRETRVQPVSELGSVSSIVAAHLRPIHGGGRVLRVDDLTFGDAVGPETPVTITVANGTVSRSLTVPASELSSERFYLSRTPNGLAVENSGEIATHVSPGAGFAPRRFAANATVAVEVSGITVVDRPVPRRATQAGARSLDRLLTGVAIETYDEPPDRSLLGYGRELRSMNWTGYTLLAVHSWDYDAIHVSGGTNIFHPDVVHEDETHYYRAADGAQFWIETANGTELYAGTANGTATVSP